MSEAELIKEKTEVNPPKEGEKIRIHLLSTLTPRETRMYRGLYNDTYEGWAKADMTVGEPFGLKIKGLHFFRSSDVTEIGNGWFHTLNSTYSWERLNE